MKSNLIDSINQRYLQSISDESKQLLQPIYGYANEPLVSLEEACEQLLSIVPRLPPHIWIAKQNSKNPADGLTQDESAAIYLYTMEWDPADNEVRPSLYSHLNQTLNMANRTKLRPWFRYLKLFLTALAKLPMQPRQTVWRGVRKDHSADYLPGTEITWWAFSSCTTSLKVLESELYLGKVGTRTLFSIEVLNSRSVSAHSAFTIEDEILLLPGTFFQVKSQFNPAPDLNIVHLVQKRTPHHILEPPFEGAQLMPPDQFTFKIEEPSSLLEKQKPWYIRRIVMIAAVFATLVITLSIVLGVVLSRQNKNDKSPILVPSFPSNASILPASVADVFYAFDDNTLDLYRRYDGVYDGIPVSYVQGYVATGKAIVFNQTEESLVIVSRLFNLSAAIYTIEAFVLVQEKSMVGNVVEFSDNVAVGFDEGYLQMIWRKDQQIRSDFLFPLNEWHHVAFVYDVNNLRATIYFDGKASASIIDDTLPIPMNNMSMYIGSGFIGIIDQLSITLRIKSDENIFWDANVAAYYPFDTKNNWLLDHGPNGLNATSKGIQLVSSQLGEALKFNSSGAFYSTTGFMALGIQNHSFTVALWIRIETTPGPFLTVASSKSCLIIFGLRNTDNRLIVFLPNSTATGENVNIIGPILPLNQWIHVAFTWSNTNHAQLYTSISSSIQNHMVTILNNQLGLPMSVTLGQYHDGTSCQNGSDLDDSKEFIGSLDEVYIYSTELTSQNIQQLIQSS